MPATMSSLGKRCAASVMHTLVADDGTCAACGSFLQYADMAEAKPVAEPKRAKRRGRYTRLSDPVRHPVTGATTTIAALLDSGEASMVRHDAFLKRDGSTRVAYCAELAGGEGWEVSPVAYRTRTGRDAMPA